MLRRRTSSASLTVAHRYIVGSTSRSSRMSCPLTAAVGWVTDRRAGAIGSGFPRPAAKVVAAGLRMSTVSSG